MQPNTPLTKMYAGSDLMLNGGAKGIRTPGLYNANVARYQLCYSPMALAFQPTQNIIANQREKCNTSWQFFYGF